MFYLFGMALFIVGVFFTIFGLMFVEHLDISLVRVPILGVILLVSSFLIWRAAPRVFNDR
jgi:hypothetical protein